MCQLLAVVSLEKDPYVVNICLYVCLLFAVHLIELCLVLFPVLSRR